jgi:hypothetical protein
MTIASSSGLSDKDIERMVSDADEYAEADKARKTIYYTYITHTCSIYIVTPQPHPPLTLSSCVE